MRNTDSPEPATPDTERSVRPDAKTAPPIDTSGTLKTGRTAAEQMEDYEQDLKENDWGHQPC